MFLKNILLTFLILLPLHALAQMDRKEDVDHFVELMSSENWAKQKEAVQLLEWAGLSEPKLFDIVEKELLKMHNKSGRPNKHDTDLISWYLKALSFSGQDKYKETVSKIEKETKSGKIKKYASQALGYFPKYKKWNTIINSTEIYNEEETPKVNRFANMIRSGEFELMRLAAKRIHYKHIYNDYLLDNLEKAILKRVDYSPKDGVETDALAWMCKALAGSRNTKYRPTIQKISKTAKSRRLQSYARKYLKYYR